MPPNEDKKQLKTDPADIRKVSPAEIVSESEVPHPERLIGFFSSDTVDAALRVSAFDVVEEIGIASRIARGSDDRLALSALNHLRNVARDAAKASGIIGTVSQTETTRDADGNEVRRIASTNTIIDRLRRDRQAIEKLEEDKDHRAIRRHATGPRRASDDVHDGSPALSGGSTSMAGDDVHESGTRLGITGVARFTAPPPHDLRRGPVDPDHEADRRESPEGDSLATGPRPEGGDEDGGHHPAAESSA